MKSISDIDKNFQIETTIDLKGRKVFDVSKEPFEIFGLIKPDENEDYYRRIPSETAKQIPSRLGGDFSLSKKSFGLFCKLKSRQTTACHELAVVKKKSLENQGFSCGGNPI